MGKSIKINFDRFTLTDLKSRIVSSTGHGGFREDVKIKALKELIKRQAKKK